MQRGFAERGLLFFGRGRHRLASDIDLDSTALREQLENLARRALDPTTRYERLELWLFPAGYDRPPIELLQTEPEPRSVVLRLEAWPRGAETATDRDVVEWLLHWPARADKAPAAPEVIQRRERRGRLSARRQIVHRSRSLRERLERLRPLLRDKELHWRANEQLALVFRAERALLALTECVHRLTESERQTLFSWCERFEKSPHEASAPLLEEPSDRLPDQWRWLPALSGRRATILRSLIRGRCPICDAWGEATTWNEAPYDRRHEVAADAGVVLHCARGHEVVRVALERT